MADYVGWAVRLVESKASTPRFQVGTILGAPKYDPPADFVPAGEAEQTLHNQRTWEAKQTYRWEWGQYCDRQEVMLALFQKGGFTDLEIKQMLDAAEVNPGKSIRHMIGTGAIEVA